MEARRLTASGSSTLGPTGAAANWIVTNKVIGKKLTDVNEFKVAMTRPHADCVRYLEGIYTQFVTKYVALQKSTKLFHGDATNGELWHLTPLYPSLISVLVRFREHLFQRQESTGGFHRFRKHENVAQ
jgi:hypothetical protein